MALEHSSSSSSSFNTTDVAATSDKLRKRRIRQSLLKFAKETFQKQQQQQQQKQQDLRLPDHKLPKNPSNNHPTNHHSRTSTSRIIAVVTTSSSLPESVSVSATASSSKNEDNDYHPPPTNDTMPLQGKIRVVAPISPTPLTVIFLILPKLNLTPKSTVVDLGCGDGRWILAAYRTYGCRCIGCDIDDVRLDLARKEISKVQSSSSSGSSSSSSNLSTKQTDRKTITIVKRDVFEFLRGGKDGVPNINTPPLLDTVDVVIVYLFRTAMQQIASILRERGIVPMRR